MLGKALRVRKDVVMKILVTGVNGQLGYDVVREGQKRGFEVIGVGSKQMDITKENEVFDTIRQHKPDAVIHCAAYTSVDAAEDNLNQARDVNVEGSKNIAKACKEIDCKLIYISTDYVFPGLGDKEFEIEDEKGPQNVYGLTKYEGELEVMKYLEKYFIVRVSWVYGLNGKNFVKTMLQLAKSQDQVNVVCDQVGSPTYSQDLSILLLDMSQSQKYGTYHATNEGFCSWYEFACEIFQYANINIKVNPITSIEFSAKAVRPQNSRLSKRSLDQAGFRRLPNWRDALKRYIAVLKEDKIDGEN